jgi:predicted ArsR family transcriptional regulator
MKTAMQELTDYMKTYFHLTDESLEMFDKALEKEKEQIANAYDTGYKACDLDEALEINKTMFSGERYYEQTYNQNK